MEVMEKATLGGGCFWCLEAAFQRVKGVRNIVSGYAGGHSESPNYREVCSGLTGHAEVVQIEYNPKEIGFTDLLSVFWQIHDPTQVDGQGADKGTQYRSIILYHDKKQKVEAEASLKEIASAFHDPVVTELIPLKKFYPAEKYHQNYFNNNPEQPYCAAVIRPKLDKLKTLPGLIKTDY